MDIQPTTPSTAGDLLGLKAGSEAASDHVPNSLPASSGPSLLPGFRMTRNMLQDANEIALASSLQELVDFVAQKVQGHLDAAQVICWIVPHEDGAQTVYSQTAKALDPKAIATFKRIADSSGETQLHEDTAGDTWMVTPIVLGEQLHGCIAARGVNEQRKEPVLTLELLAAMCAIGIGHRSHIGIEEAQRQQAQQLQEMQADYLGAIAHDVRGPLTVISGYASMLGQLPHERQGPLGELIVQQAARIERLMNSILDVARARSGRLELRRRSVAFDEMIAEQLTGIDPERRTQLHTVDPDGLGFMISVDVERLEQVWANLLGNSLAYGEAPHDVHVERRRDEIQVSIRDHGAGLPQHVVDHLFEQYVPGAHKVGLGMAVAHDMIVLHGGQIRYEDAQPGARFVIILPMEAS